MSSKLSEKQKNELRIMIEKDLENVPDGMRKKMPKDMLEELIFRSSVKIDGEFECDALFLMEDSLVEGEANNVEAKINDILSKCKFPVWTGKFLSKLDLSELSFEGVVWSLDDIYSFLRKFPGSVRITDDSLNKFMRKICDFYFPTSDKFYISDPEVNWDDENKKALFIGDINFANTNANIKFDYAFRIFNPESGSEEINLRYCDFSGTDLSRSGFDNVDTAGSCEFTDCGLNIVLDDTRNNLRESLRTCQIDGCYINGRLVDSRIIDEEKKSSIQQESAALYERYVQAFQNAELVPIEEDRRGRH